MHQSIRLIPKSDTLKTLSMPSEAQLLVFFTQPVQMDLSLNPSCDPQFKFFPYGGLSQKVDLYALWSRVLQHSSSGLTTQLVSRLLNQAFALENETLYTGVTFLSHLL